MTTAISTNRLLSKATVILVYAILVLSAGGAVIGALTPPRLSVIAGALTSPRRCPCALGQRPVW